MKDTPMYAMGRAEAVRDPVFASTSQIIAIWPIVKPALEAAPAEKSRAKFLFRKTASVPGFRPAAGALNSTST